MTKKSLKDSVRDLANEIDVFDDMLTSLIEVLEEKGILTQEEWESKIKRKVEKRSKSLSLRDIQFENTE
ncbi:hypothetical protein KAU92_03210 [Candidatus Bathyarchaeota archaeon]|nr:hypothetical protein [Candidatus Bathyarchaeota archaeon]